MYHDSRSRRVHKHLGSPSSATTAVGTAQPGRTKSPTSCWSRAFWLLSARASTTADLKMYRAHACVAKHQQKPWWCLHAMHARKLGGVCTPCCTTGCLHAMHAMLDDLVLACHARHAGRLGACMPCTPCWTTGCLHAMLHDWVLACHAARQHTHAHKRTHIHTPTKVAHASHAAQHTYKYTPAS
jgi:hypothetical protein